MRRGAPVLVLGMHRSGTSLVTRMLRELGCFFGARREGNEEALLFLALNNWLLRQSGGAWDAPEAIDPALRDAAFRRRLAGYLSEILASPRGVQYTGVRHWRPGVFAPPEPWGWKDPRTTFTLPVWLELFPEARVVHVQRHGVDVAESLRVRCQRGLDRLPRARDLFGPGFWLKPSTSLLRDGLAWSVRERDAAFELWTRYVDRAERHVEELGERAMTLRFEDTLREPRAELERLVSFCGLDADGDALERAAALADASRAFPYRKDPELQAFAADRAAALARRGYP